MRLRRGGFGALLFGCALQALAAPVTLNLKDADVNTLAAAVSQITGKTFVIDPRVRARVTVIAARAMEEAEVYDLFLAVLAVHGLAAVPGEKFVKIVPEGNAKTDQVPTVEGAGAAADDQIVTRVIQVRYAPAGQLLAILRPLVPPQGHLAASSGNTLVISDRAANVERIAQIVARVDVANTQETEVVRLRYASAGELVRVLGSLDPRAAGGDPAASVGQGRLIADEHTNSVLLAGDRDSRLRLRALIGHLDVPVRAEASTQVVALRYAKAKDLVEVLQGLGKTLEPVAQVPGGPQGAPVLVGAGQISVQADEASNTVVLTAPPEPMRALKAVIGQLDTRRAQVLVEAVIAEIAVEKSAELGVQWLLDARHGANTVGIVNFNNLLPGLAAAAREGTVPDTLPSGGQLALGVQAGAVRFGALISALASTANTNVLSTPSIVTLDNQEAEIVVGQNVPFVTGTFTTSVGGSGGGVLDGGLVGNPFQTIQRQDVGLTLRVKPQISAGGAVRLEIEQEVSSVASVSPSQGPTTNKRALKTSVLVGDDQVLVLGGLLDDNVTEGEDKVPGLGDIPVLGELFKYRSTKKVKRNLVVFLHPVILRDDLRGSAYTQERYEDTRAQQRRAGERDIALLPGERTPVLPAFEPGGGLRFDPDTFSLRGPLVLQPPPARGGRARP